MTAAGYGSLAHLGLSSPAKVAVTQAYIALVVLTGWVLAQEVAGRTSAVHDLDSEHAMAVLLQRAVMPTMAAAIPGLDIGASYRQAGTTRYLGGDWYDALVLPAGRVYLAVGDVVGHGLAAAVDMTQLRNAARALAIGGHQPADILCELALVTDWATSGKYATMVAATVEPGAALLTYATAGHPPILIRRAKTDVVEIPLPTAGPPLCLLTDDVLPRYTQNQVGLDPGDIVLMYTDGLIERRGEDVAEGIARVAEQLQAWRWRPGLPLGDLCEQLVSSLAVEPQLDDVCVLAVARPGGLVAGRPGSRGTMRIGARALQLTRAAYGTALVLVPGQTIRLVTDRDPSQRACRVARVLGARHLTQTALTAVTPRPAVFAAGVQVDALHAASMLLLAAAGGPGRKAALADALTEAAFTVVGLSASIQRP